MGLPHRLDYLRAEHDELLNLANRIEKLLEFISKGDFAVHVKNLVEL